jgi:hypothetical protein
VKTVSAAAAMAILLATHNVHGAPSAGAIAVFHIRSVDTSRVPRAAVEKLSSELSERLAAEGEEVVPDASLGRLLEDLQRNSMSACYDESCQIEIGRGVAAQQVLQTRIVQYGTSECVLTSVLFDLRTETSDWSYSRALPCRWSAIREAVLDIPHQLVAGRKRRKKQATTIAVLPPKVGDKSLAPPIFVESFAHYFAILLAETEQFRVVPPSAVLKVLRERKLDSYSARYDETSQVAVGGALPAEAVVSSSIVKNGDVCSVSATFFDTSRISSTRAVSTRSSCRPYAIARSFTRIAEEVAGRPLGSHVEKRRPIRFNSIPPGARVVLDGEPACSSTPCVRDLEERVYTAEFLLDDHVPRRREFAVDDVREVTVELNSRYGYLTFLGGGGAGVAIDGTTVGTSPISNHKVRPGTHEFKIVGDCFEDAASSVHAEAGEHVVVRLETFRRTVKVNLVVTDSRTKVPLSGASLTADGRRIRFVDGTAHLPACTKRIDVERRGYRSRQIEFGSALTFNEQVVAPLEAKDWVEANSKWLLREEEMNLVESQIHRYYSRDIEVYGVRCRARGAVECAVFNGEELFMGCVLARDAAMDSPMGVTHCSAGGTVYFGDNVGSRRGFRACLLSRNQRYTPAGTRRVSIPCAKGGLVKISNDGHLVGCRLEQNLTIDRVHARAMDWVRFHDEGQFWFLKIPEARLIQGRFCEARATVYFEEDGRIRDCQVEYVD